MLHSESLKTSNPVILPRVVHQREVDHCRHRANLLEVLVGMAFPVPTDCPSLRAIWAVEAMNRSLNMLRLVMLHEARWAQRPQSSLCAQLELGLGKQLSLLFASLTIPKEYNRRRPCSDALSGIIIGLDALFGSIAGEVVLSTDLPPISLPSRKRRALVLAAAELVTRLLLEKPHCGFPLQVAVTLTQTSVKNAVLAVEDDLPVDTADNNPEGLEIVSDLASILDGVLLLRQSSLGGTAAELHFDL
jgi:hypothetical protein